MKALKTADIELVPLSSEHFDTLYVVSQNPNSIEDYQLASTDRKYFDNWIREALNNDHITWTVFFQGHLCGLIGFEQVSEPIVSMGYFIDQPFQGRGIATQVIDLAVRFLFRETNAQEVHVQVTKNNIGSQRVLEKNGFIKTQEIPKNWNWRGRIYDSIEYQIKRP